MGGAIAILTVDEKRDNFSGLILTSLLLLPNPQSATSLKAFAAKLLNYVLRNLSLGSIDPSFKSLNKKGVEDYSPDPLLLNATSRVEKALPLFNVPLLLFHGTVDKLCVICVFHVMIDTIQKLPEVTSSVFQVIESWLQHRLGGTGSSNIVQQASST
ncbi:hypothetical protein XELAEV_18018060mg [Xenopus laevis]|uniref:Serine aminopeptidase S33 domain-containing protein n=1 Tax=Xenopus laevis TaxID=8355 RepID=A0A974DCA9_XENLA|nr:hypothetical protein XELAEV_18018060mg [Xenopus laevis]